jgi:hypothetical protein
MGMVARPTTLQSFFMINPQDLNMSIVFITNDSYVNRRRKGTLQNHSDERL